jgi:predicted dehydrogenase
MHSQHFRCIASAVVFVITVGRSGFRQISGVRFALTCGYIVHPDGETLTPKPAKANHITARELRAYGSKGSYRALGTDVQAQAIFAGRYPAADPQHWGYEDQALWGTLATAEGKERVPAAQGRWHDFYSEFAAAARGEAAQPVPATEGVETLRVLDAALQSALHGTTVQLVNDYAGRAT